jgi:RNA polymerase subunit RPABC4/transcription elongation factor Spt4
MDHDLQERAENAAVPNDTRQLRACQRCHLVLPLRQFERWGRPPTAYPAVSAVPCSRRATRWLWRAAFLWHSDSERSQIALAICPASELPLAVPLPWATRRYRSEGGGETTHGCPNCGEWDDAASMCCVNFTGVAAIVNPEASWVARWLGRRKCCSALCIRNSSIRLTKSGVRCLTCSTWQRIWWRAAMRLKW